MSGGSRRTLLILSAALGVDYADRSVVGAVGPELKARFGIGNSGLGLVASSFAVFGALATIPAGVVVDRANRIRLLRIAFVLWGVAMAAGGGATALWMLLASRVVLGALVAVARPAAASIVGDVYPPSGRSRAMGVVNAGELVGTGVGLAVAAFAASRLSWRGVFWILAGIGGSLSVLARRVPEPARRADVRGRSVVEAFREVLRTKTVVIVIVASAVGYFFFAGVRTFAVTFTARHYGVSQAAADVLMLAVGGGAIAGLVVGGRVGDVLTNRRRQSARLVFAAGAFVAATVLFGAALLVRPLVAAMPLYVGGSAALASASPLLDAVRLDVIAPRLRGRAESVRTVTQVVFEAIAPLGFGLVADALGGGGRGLQLAFLASLPLLLANGLILLLARRPLEREFRRQPGRR